MAILGDKLMEKQTTVEGLASRLGNLCYHIAKRWPWKKSAVMYSCRGIAGETNHYLFVVVKIPDKVYKQLVQLSQEQRCLAKKEEEEFTARETTKPKTTKARNKKLLIRLANTLHLVADRL